MLSREEFARRLRMARAHGTPDGGELTQEDLAVALGGYNRMTISAWETRGLRGPQQTLAIKAIAEATGLPVEFFYADWAELPRAIERCPELDLRYDPANDALAEGGRLLAAGD